MKKELLLIAGTHGNETICIEAIKSLKKKNNEYFDWVIGNRKAVDQNRRFLKIDLNRAAPGDIHSQDYEIKRAAELIALSQRYRFTIDIHGSTADCGIFAIVTNPKIKNLLLAATLPVENIVIWIAKKSEIINPVSEFFACGLEIECGPKTKPAVKNELKNILTNIIKNGITFDMKKMQKKQFFVVYGSLTRSDKNLKDFVATEINGEIFYPLLTGQYKESGTTCYKMKKLSLFDILSY